MKTLSNATPPSETPVTPPAHPDDHPAVWVFPPILPLGGLALGFMLEQFFPPANETAGLSASMRHIGGAILLAAGLIIMISGRRAMMRTRTNVDPRRPALRLVRAWPFSWTRNPMYLGGNLGVIGLGLLFRLHWMLAFYPILIAICHYGVVLPEEEYLERKFGAEYRRYKARVRRWL